MINSNKVVLLEELQRSLEGLGLHMAWILLPINLAVYGSGANDEFLRELLEYIQYPGNTPGDSSTDDIVLENPDTYFLTGDKLQQSAAEGLRKHQIMLAAKVLAL